MNRIREAFSRWVFDAIYCRHDRVPIGVRHYEALQGTAPTHKIAMTSVARRCRKCGDIDAISLAGSWELHDLTGPPAAAVAENLIHASLGKGVQP